MPLAPIQACCRCLAIGVVLLFVGALPDPARAVSMSLTLDPSQSQLTPQVGSPESLSGTLDLSLGSAPPLASPTTLDLVNLGVTGGGLTITLNGGLSFPGAGVLATDGSFLIPNLFLVVNGQDLTVNDVTGSFGVSAACGGSLCLETAFDVDSGAPAGIVNVLVVAVPEPTGWALLAMAGAVLAHGGFRRKEGLSCDS